MILGLETLQYDKLVIMYIIIDTVKSYKYTWSMLLVLILRPILNVLLTRSTPPNDNTCILTVDKVK